LILDKLKESTRFLLKRTVVECLIEAGLLAEFALGGADL